MPRFFLRIEGVNLANIIFDTDDLSTRRGGGLMLLTAPQQIEEELRSKFPSFKINTIATGASIGLFEIEAEQAEIDLICEKLRTWLQQHDLMKHATFVVEHARVEESDYATEQRLTATTRWQQMQSPSLSWAGLWDDATEPCHYDKIRPGSIKSHSKDDEPIPVSPSADARREYGRSEKQKFYARELGKPLDLTFTNDFQEIATHPDPDYPISNKLAVFYVDGNKFGEKGRTIFQNAGAEGFKNWSDALRAHHRKLLAKLLGIAAKDSLWKNSEMIRLETLLWGGDEIIWVVPAWKGWELAKWFFSQEHTVDGSKVSYSCGMVFCNAKAPIQNVITLAMRLADLAKEAAREKEEHALAYEVLESFDDIPGSLEDYRERWLPDGADSKSLILKPDSLKWDNLLAIAVLDEFPIRQLYNWCRAWREGNETMQRKAETRMKDACRDQQLSGWIQNQPVNYLHLLQMLPYLPESYRAAEVR